MAATQGGNLGLYHSWAFRESGWKTGMDANLLKLDAIVQLDVISNALTSPPGGESDGDRYLIAATASGDWLGKENQIAAYQGSAYTYYVPATGWLCYAENDSKLYVYTGAAWSAIASGATGSLPAGTWDDPFNFGSGAAYMWFDATNGLWRGKVGSAPGSEADVASVVFMVG